MLIMHIAVAIRTAIRPVRIATAIIYRGYYTAVRRYEFCLRVVKTISYERAQRVKYCFHHEKIKFKPPCNVLGPVVSRQFLVLFKRLMI